MLPYFKATQSRESLSKPYRHLIKLLLIPRSFTPWGILAFGMMGDKSDVRCAVVERVSVFLP